MKFYRIERCSEQTFYALAAGEADLCEIIKQSERFLPVEHTMTPVDPGDVPFSSTVLTLGPDRHGRVVQRVSHLRAMVKHEAFCATRYRDAIETAKRALLESGISGELRLELQNSEQAIQLLEAFAYEIQVDTYRQIQDDIRRGAVTTFCVSGVHVSWPLPPGVSPWRRLERWFWPGGSVVSY